MLISYHTTFQHNAVGVAKKLLYFSKDLSSLLLEYLVEMKSLQTTLISFLWVDADCI